MCLSNAIPLDNYNGVTKCYKVLVSDGKGCFVSPFQRDEYRCAQVKYADGYPDVQVEKDECLLDPFKDTPLFQYVRQRITVGGGFLHTCQSVDEALKFMMESCAPDYVTGEFPYWIVVECEIPAGCPGFIGVWDCYSIVGYASSALTVNRPLTFEELKNQSTGFSDRFMDFVESKYDKTDYSDMRALLATYKARDVLSNPRT